MTNNTDPAGLSSSPRYRVVADRDKGDNPTFSDVEYGDRYTAVCMPADWEVDRVDRIERPVPTTDEPERCEQCDDFEPETHVHPSVPTREQIAEWRRRLLDRSYEFDADRRADLAAVLALIQKEDKK